LVSVSSTQTVRSSSLIQTEGTIAAVLGVDHLDLVVTDLERSLEFYTGLLEPLGFTRTSEIEGERGERVVYIGGVGVPSVSLRERQSDSHPTPYDRYAVGIHHLAFVASSREQVDERAAWLRDRGAEIESEPREYDYTPQHYAVFFYDPDGIKLEIVHRPQTDRY
jgi:catechol 2,3-dioxygenase-like lactoylglutathione lyase family enzyme